MILAGVNKAPSQSTNVYVSKRSFKETGMIVMDFNKILKSDYPNVHINTIL